ncbi:GntR family transcriptional regulator [Paralimibaculum aggregatum]|uniref:GntR family transcriptional regulator n=1 Tax=Paralimibaculum aggregatum TaxID=3036245 RepID=A0ABQ6LPB7_9RHOB|nr:GntR family transcriptional regulator [Limibaculum sp. NKW23]GMG83128.1 GntR family transcriptional regulator [Limibaculum sp. NKW23]
MSRHDPELAGDRRLPLYQRLADELRREINAGRWKPGERAPSETWLAEHFEIAPGTARQAIAMLVDEGLLERFRGKGTFVRRPRFDHSLFRFFRFRDRSGENRMPEGRILHREVAPMPDHVAEALGLGADALGIAMSRLRLIGGEPVLAEEIWLPAGPFADFLEIPVGEVGPLLYPVYESACGQLVVSADEALRAEAAGPETARLLQIDAGAPVIVIDRLARGIGGAPLEWRRSRGRADQFHYTTEIR